MDRLTGHVSKDRGSGAPQDTPLSTRLRLAPVTAGILGLLLLLFAGTLAGTLAQAPEPFTSLLQSLWALPPLESRDLLVSLGALELTRVWLDHEWWRLLTTGLLHGSILHLALNALALLSISEWIELECGRLHALTTFLLGSLGGALASLVWCESPIVLGASAGILGQAGGLWLARVFGPDALRARLALVSPGSLGVLILVCLSLGLILPGIAQAGHLGGLIAGLLVAGAWLARSPWLRLSLLAGLAAMLLDLAWVGSAPTGRSNYFQFLGARMRDDGHATEALTLFRTGLTHDPTNANFRNEIAYQFALDGVELEYAEQLALEAVALEPINVSYLDTLAWVWCRQGHSTPALRLLNAVVFLSDELSPEIEEHRTQCATSSVFHVKHSVDP